MSVYLQLRLAEEKYAIQIDQVIQVARFGDLTAVPGSPAALLGVRNLRGQVLPVIDLAQLLGISGTTQPAHLVVGTAGGRQAGLAIDEVTEIGELADPTQETDSAVLAGASLADGELIGVIDMVRVFDAVAGVRQ